MAVLLLNVSCKTLSKSACVASDCGKEILVTKFDPCRRPEPQRRCPTKQRIASTRAATEKLKRQNPETLNPIVKNEVATGSSQLAEVSEYSSRPKIEVTAFPQPEITPVGTISVEKKLVEKMVEVENTNAIEKKPVESIVVLERKLGDKLVDIEDTSERGMPVDTSSVVEKAPDESATKTPILVETDNANRIIVADEREVEIKGSNCVIVISGGCKKLKLSGERNQVQCDAASFVDISGDQNTLVLGVIGRSLVTGNNNIISWGEGMDGTAPIAESTGQENEIGRLE